MATAATAEHCQRVIDGLTLMFQGGESTDVCFEVDNAVFKGHRVVLCAVSDYFKTLLSGPFNESDGSGKISISIMSSKAFASMLEFIYTGQLSRLSSDNIVEFALAGEAVCLPKLGEYCSQRLAVDDALLNLHNCCNLLKAAVGHRRQQGPWAAMTHTCANFIARNLPAIVELKGDQGLAHLDLASLAAVVEEIAPSIVGKPMLLLALWDCIVEVAAQELGCKDLSAFVRLLQTSSLDTLSFISEATCFSLSSRSEMPFPFELQVGGFLFKGVVCDGSGFECEPFAVCIGLSDKGIRPEHMRCFVALQAQSSTHGCKWLENVKIGLPMGYVGESKQTELECLGDIMLRVPPNEFLVQYLDHEKPVFCDHAWCDDLDCEKFWRAAENHQTSCRIYVNTFLGLALEAAILGFSVQPQTWLACFWQDLWGFTDMCADERLAVENGDALFREIVSFASSGSPDDAKHMGAVNDLFDSFHRSGSDYAADVNVCSILKAAADSRTCRSSCAFRRIVGKIFNATVPAGPSSGVDCLLGLLAERRHVSHSPKRARTE